MFDLMIIGAGPAGITAAVYAARARIDTIWLDGSFVPGGQIAESGMVDNYPGFPQVSGSELGDRLCGHAELLGMRPVRERVKRLTRISPEEAGDEKGYFAAETRKNRYEARNVILATGASHRHLMVPGEEMLSGSGISYCATCDGAFFRDRAVAVVGGGNTACEDAIFLARLCKKVYLVHRRDALRADAVLQELVMDNPVIQIVWNSVPVRIEGENQVTGLTLHNRVSGEESILIVEGVFVAVGMIPNTDLVKDMAVLDPAGYVIAGEDCASSVPGLYAAGDLRTKVLRQVVTAVSDGANAVASVQRRL